jgi:hypothetical protein
MPNKQGVQEVVLVSADTSSERWQFKHYVYKLGGSAG